jgi:tetratricopeptide (TPR) repeat protein
MLVANDSRDVPHLVSAIADIAIVEDAIIDLISMKLNHEVCRQPGKTDPSVALHLVLAIDLLCSMEKSGIDQAAEICASLSMSDLTDWRTITILSAIGSWTAGDLASARDEFQSVISVHSRDVLSIFAVHMLDFYIGDSQHLLASISAVIGKFSTTDRALGYLCGMHGFALEESGEIDPAIECCDRAMKLNPDDIYAMHAMVHCLYESGRHDEGSRYIRDYMCGRSASTPMRIHIWWHYGLFQLYAENIQEAIACYRIGIRRKTSLRSPEDLDAVTMLWRLNLTMPTLDLSPYWRSLFEDWKPYLEDNWYVFNDFHAYIVYCQAHEYDYADSLLGRMRARVRGHSFPPEMLDIFLGFKSFSAGEYSEAASRLARSLDHSHQIGGSNAQRDVIEMTAVEAALRSRNYELAKYLRDTGRIFRHYGAMLERYDKRLVSLLPFKNGNQEAAR